MKKILSFALALAVCVSMLVGCTKKLAPVSSVSTPATGSQGTAADANGLIDGKFVETRKISVEIFDRANDGGSDPTNNKFTDFIKKGMLEKHNVEVEFVSVPRWTEVEQMNNLLAADSAPDICVTYSYPTIQTYALMGGVLDMAPLIKENESILPNLYDLLGEPNLFWNEDPTTGTVWAIEAYLAINNGLKTFVREDWLKALNLEKPETRKEFEEVLIAFRDNADKLLGDEADKMIPFLTTYDVGWNTTPIITSFTPEKFSDEDAYVYGFDDRKFLYPGTKEAIREINKWYNDGLIWKDFPLYGAGDTTPDNLLKAGYVGAYIQNSDALFRNGEDSIFAALKRNAGEDAAFITVNPFENDEGKKTKFYPAPVDRKVFFPATNKEPIASMLYLDFISDIETRKYLQIGDVGVNHEVTETGAIKSIVATGADIMNSGNNIDYTITVNGLDLGDEELTMKSIAVGYAGVDPAYVEDAFITPENEKRYGVRVNVGAIVAEEGVGNSLTEKRDAILNQSVVAKPDKFDSIWDSGMKDYLNSGAQAIIDERRVAYEKFYK